MDENEVNNVCIGNQLSAGATEEIIRESYHSNSICTPGDIMSHQMAETNIALNEGLQRQRQLLEDFSYEEEWQKISDNLPEWLKLIKDFQGKKISGTQVAL